MLGRDPLRKKTRKEIFLEEMEPMMPTTWGGEHAGGQWSPRAPWTPRR
jgi:hypothetical protein